jgi:TetR/AcrR family transcriptional repressor of nem operon
MARPREFEEADVVQSAMGVFWEKGYAFTSVQDLVDATGLQRGSLYGAFGDKHQLYLAAIDTYCDQALAEFRGLVAAAKDPVDAVRNVVRSRGRASVDAVRASHGCLVGNACSDLEADDEQTRIRLQVFVREMRAEMARALREGQRLGTFDSARDADATALFVQCSLQGLVLLGKSRLNPEDVQSVVEEIIRSLD